MVNSHFVRITIKSKQELKTHWQLAEHVTCFQAVSSNQTIDKVQHKSYYSNLRHPNMELCYWHRHKRHSPLKVVWIHFGMGRCWELRRNPDLSTCIRSLRIVGAWGRMRIWRNLPHMCCCSNLHHPSKVQRYILDRNFRYLFAEHQIHYKMAGQRNMLYYTWVTVLR